MNIAAHIIDRFGSATALGKTLSVPVSTILSWKRSGFIPAKHQGAVLAAAKLAGLGLSAEDFFDQTGDDDGEGTRQAQKEQHRDAAAG